VAYKDYHNVAYKLNKEKCLAKLDIENLKLINTYFPGIIDKKVFEYTGLAYKISLLDNDIAGYILGFPIQNVIPSDSDIASALTLLTELGMEEYINKMSKFVRQTYLPFNFFNEKETNFSNETDVLCEDIDSYVSFDIVAYQTGNCIYRFTRAEFDKYIESKKNPYTNEWLPISVLSTIISRTKAAKDLGFPRCYTMMELFKRIEHGDLFSDDKPSDKNLNSNTNNNNRMPNFHVFMGFNGNITQVMNEIFGDFDGDASNIVLDG
jgi:hypothetical protein